VAGEDAPDLARVLQFRLADFEVIERDSLAVEHAKDVVIGLHKELCRIGEGLILSKPGRLRMPVRADDGQGANVLVQSPGYLSRTWLGWEQTIFVDQHNCNLLFRCEARRSDYS